ncbi:MAG: hypothetical protein ABR78_02055 [Acidimicrobiia bacterium BACL6 MAG-120910-bin40]|nr:MAG: hypothetical protein ABR78_02055 [Acidimicrobiia bacterium BACL6 MAG-120910-bin40]
MVDARFSDLVVIRCRCGVQNCHQKLNLQVFFREDFRQLFRNFKKSQPIFGNFKKFFQNIFLVGNFKKFWRMQSFLGVEFP